MRIEIVDIYKEFSLPRPQTGAGRLTCYISRSPDNISPGRQRPGVLILPGGGYGHTSTREGEPVALRYLARGWQAFVLEYSCAPCVFPTALREAAMAMAYIRAHARALEVSPDKLAAVGFSAGGHLCGCLGTLYDCPEVADIAPAGQIRPDALGLHYPVTVSWGRTHEGSFRNISCGDAALAARLSLEKLVRPDMPPVFLWHTRNDASVPCRGSLLLGAALEEAGVDFAMHVYPRGPHGMSTGDELVYPVASVPKIGTDTSRWIELELEFFREIGMKIEDPEEEI